MGARRSGTVAVTVFLFGSLYTIPVGTLAQDPHEAETLDTIPGKRIIQETEEADTDAAAPAEDEKTKLEDVFPGEILATLTFGTDYIFRGLSYNNRSPSIQGSLTWAHESGFYVGVFSANADFAPGVNFEIDPYGGFATQIGNWTLDLLGVYYTWPGAGRFNFPEFVFYPSYNFGFASLTAEFAYTWEYFQTKNSGYTGGKLDLPVQLPLPDLLPKTLTIEGHIGHQFIETPDRVGIPSYTDWSAGVKYSILGFDLLLAYIDTDIPTSECSFGDICGPIPYFAASRTF